MTKRIADILVATILLVATFPLLTIIGIILLCVQGRPILYRQRRIGLHSIPFTLYKFRTMIDGAPPRYSHLPVAKQPGDTRITPFGAFLRRSALDELPQLLNILRGEMSLVGPRPLPKEDLEQPGWLNSLSSDERQRRIIWLARRHEVLPGLSGLWQITTRPAEDFDNWIERDLAYVDQHSLLDDLLILLRTPLALIRGRRNSSVTGIIPSVTDK